MANLKEQDQTWDEGVYQIETSDPVLGGENGITNKPLINLANRTGYLKRVVDSKAALNSPALTGTPQAPTQPIGDNTTKLATTAFVQVALNALPKVDLTPYIKITDADNKYAFKSITVNGQPLSKNVNLTAGDVNAYTKQENDAKFALSTRKINGKQLTTDILLTATDLDAAPTSHVHALANITGLENALASKAALNSPALTGTPQAPTQPVGDNTTKLATTAFVQVALNALPKVDLTPFLKLTDADNKYAFKSITVNGQPLSKNVNLTAGDVNAYTKQENDAKFALSARKINNKALTADVMLTAGDVGAAAINGSNIDVPSYLQKLGLKEVSLAQNGWGKLPCGLIIQWGKFTLPVANPTNAKNLTFPIAFPNACHVVLGTAVSNTNHAESLEIGMIDKTGAGFGTFYITSSTGSHAGVVCWLAIGY